MIAAFTLFVFSAPVLLTAQRQPTTAELLKAGKEALDARRFVDALAAFESAATRAPQSADAWRGLGLAAFFLGRAGDAESALLRAVSLEPDFTEASALLGELQYRRGQLSEAIATYEAALKYAPQQKQLTEKIAQWRQELGVEGRFIESRGAHFRVRFEGPEDQALARRAVEMLEAAYLRTGAALRVYPTQAIEVVLYTEQQFRDVTRSPSWAGGLYDGRIRVPIKGAAASLEHLQVVLEHEFVHALVANVGGPAVPMWVNEGLATVLEAEGLASARQILDTERGRLPLGRLHGSFGALPPPLVPLAYAQSTVAVAKMLEQGAPAVVMLLRDVASGVAFDVAFHRRIGLPYLDFQQSMGRQ